MAVFLAIFLYDISIEFSQLNVLPVHTVLLLLLLLFPQKTEAERANIERLLKFSEQNYEEAQLRMEELNGINTNLKHKVEDLEEQLEEVINGKHAAQEEIR